MAKSDAATPPDWVRPQLTELVDGAPEGDDWLHEIKYDGYRMMAGLDRSAVKLLTRIGLEFAIKIGLAGAERRHGLAIAGYLRVQFVRRRPRRDDIVQHRPARLRPRQRGGAGLLPVRSALPRRRGSPPRPLIERKERLRALLADAAPCLHYSEHVIGQGPAFYERACAMRVEGIVSKRIDAPYVPANRGLWCKVKCLNRAEFVVVGWTEPEGRRPHLGALLLGYYDPHGRLVYAGRVGTGMNDAELQQLWRRLQPLAVDSMPVDVPPPRGSRFGSPLVLSRVHWVKPELVAEVKFLA